MANADGQRWGGRDPNERTSGARPRALPAQDVSGDEALRGATTVKFEGLDRPSLGGIPLIARLGRGGMGVVYYGVHPRLMTEVAIKTLPRFLEEKHAGFVERFVREAQFAARIRSENLVAVLDVDRDASTGSHFIVMEYVRGTSASAWAESESKAGRPIRERDALDLCIAATRGLSAAHTEGIVHRDVKPENVFLPRSADGRCDFARAKLGDLGLARPDADGESLTTPQLTLGTPGYMAPEQIGDARAARKPADAFGMGATLYALLTGRPPFAGPTPIDAIIKTRDGRFAPLAEVRPGVSRATTAVVARCLQTDPKQRFPDAPALLEALMLARTELDSAPTVAADLTAQIAQIAERTEQGRRVESVELDGKATTAAELPAGALPPVATAAAEPAKTVTSAPAPMPAPAPAVAQPATGARSMLPWIVVGAVGLVAIAAVIAIFVSQSKDPPPGSSAPSVAGAAVGEAPSKSPLPTVVPEPAPAPPPAVSPAPPKTDSAQPPTPPAPDPVRPSEPPPKAAPPDAPARPAPEPPREPPAKPDPVPPPPPAAPTAPAPLDAARTALAAGRFSEALREFDAAAADPARAAESKTGRDAALRGLVTEAVASEQQGRHAEAVARFDVVLTGLNGGRTAEGVDAFDVTTRLADALIGMEDFARAAKVLEVIPAARRTDPLVKMLHAKRALGEGGGSDWPKGVVAELTSDRTQTAALAETGKAFLASAQREYGLGLAREALLDAQVAATVLPKSIEAEFYVGASLAMRLSGGKGRPGDAAKSRRWLSSFVEQVDAKGAEAGKDLAERREEASKALASLPASDR